MSYPGGKGNCFRHVINLMPFHKTYIETHLGGGSVFLNKRAADINILIDLDPDVIKRFKTSHPFIEDGHYRLICGGALWYLTKNSFSTDTLIYCDPPYLSSTRKSGRLYKFEYDRSAHRKLLLKLVSLSCMVMISGYPNVLYNEILDSWTRHYFQTSDRSGTLRNECIWYNFPKPDFLHDYSFAGSSFRDREIIRRQSFRWCRRLNSMDSTRRNSLLFSIVSAFKKDLEYILKNNF